MAIEHILCLPTRYQDLSILTVNDETVYDVSIAYRDSAARVLLGAAINEDQTLDWITDIDNSDPLNTLVYTMTSKGDGAYRFFYIDIGLYGSSANYVGETLDADGKILTYAHIVYHPSTSEYYKAKGTVFQNIEPTVTSGWEDHWDLFDIADIYSQLLSPHEDFFIYDDVITGAYEDCVLAKADETCKAILCNSCTDESWIKMEKMEFLLDAVNSKNWQNKAVQAAVILKQADKKFCC